MFANVAAVRRLTASLPLRVATLVIVGAVLAAVAPAISGATTTEGIRVHRSVKRGPITVERSTLELVDRSRATPPNRDYPGAPDRTLVTTVSYPTRGGTPLRGPLALVVFATGFGGTGLNYAPMYDHWVRADYVVAAPAFPLSREGAPGGETVSDLENQPGDLRFVTTAVLEQGRTRRAPLGGLVDPERVALVG